MHRSVSARPGEDAFDLVKRAHFQAGGVTSRSATPLPRGAYPWLRLARAARSGPPPPPFGKIHPRLLATLGVAPPDEVLTLLVSLRDSIQIPRFPPAIPSSMGPAADSLRLVRTQAMIDSLRGVRAPSYRVDSLFFASRYGAKVIRTYWLTRAMLIQAQRRFVDSLANLPQVVFVRATRQGEVPPSGACVSPLSPCQARQAMHSDSYVDANLGDGKIALIDSGVRSGHVLLGRVDGRFDCVGGDEHCEGGATTTDACTEGHGTASAAIISAGLTDLGTDVVGVTEAKVESFRVYANNPGVQCSAEMDADAVVRAFQESVRRGAYLILANLDADEPPEGDVAVEADKAFEAGAVVIAANGNRVTTAAGSPALARRVLGVGAYRADTGNMIGGFSGGATWDQRAKPDLLAPGDTRTADNSGDETVSSFSGTSGAAPYATGAALLARNLILARDGHVDPGQVNAFLILSGQHNYPFEEKHGAGAIQLPTNCWAFWGKVALGQREPATIPIESAGLGGHTLEAAIWWPELSPAAGGKGRNEIDLTILDPYGDSKSLSCASNTVFQRTTCSISSDDGNWKLYLFGTNVPTEPQVVYWAAVVR
jgi:subtilisin family serine protease